MTIPKWITIKRVIYVSIALVAAIFISSWIAGQCRDWKQPKEVPEKVDTGVPTPGPVNSAPTALACLPVAIPELNKDQEMAVLAKYGLKPSKSAPESSKSADAVSVSDPSGKPLEPIHVASADMSQIIPLAETTFTHEESGVSVDVFAWVDGFGTRIQQTAQWHAWKPPVKVTQDGGWLENEARWEKFIMLGYVGMVNRDADGKTTTDAAPGLGLGLAYKSWRVSRATFEARTIGILTMDGDGAAIGGLSVSW